MKVLLAIICTYFITGTVVTIMIYAESELTKQMPLVYQLEYIFDNLVFWYRPVIFYVKQTIHKDK